MAQADPMDVVRGFYRALNRGDLDALAAFYHPHCVAEYVFEADDGVYEGKSGVVGRWAVELAARPGALPGGHRVDVSRIAGIETGWGWVRAEWTSAEGPGYSHFWVEDGLIRRHRTRRRESGNDLGGRFAGLDPRSSETTPEVDSRIPTSSLHPVVGVGAVVLTSDGMVVLVKRRNEPLAGQWSLPGGTLELGESLESGTAREVLEETGLIVDVGPVVEVFDRILLDDEAGVRFHFVLVDYLCRPRGGKLQAGSDVSDVMLANPAGLAALHVVEKAQAVVALALERQREL